MNKRNSILFLVSLFISLSLHFYAFLKFQNTISKQQEKQQPKSGGSQEEREPSKIWFRKTIVPCDSYDGIGIQFMSLTGVVTTVAQDGPAWKAGLRVGDELVTPLWSMDLKYGQEIEVIVKRKNINLKFNILVDRICKDEAN